jgi:signal transduction histidine kinase
MAQDTNSFLTARGRLPTDATRWVNMTYFTLRSQLLIATVLIIFALTGAILLIVRHTVGTEIQKQVQEGTQESVHTFKSVQQQRELQLSRSAEMLASLPTLQAMMTTDHAPTIQDASEKYWKLSGSDLLVLAKPDREVVALHANQPRWNAAATYKELNRSMDLSEEASWWYDNGLLYWVFLRPITAGAGETANPLGLLVVGYQVDATVAQQLAAVTGGQIALTSGDKIIASTLPASDESQLQNLLGSAAFRQQQRPELVLQTDHYASASVDLHDGASSPVRCYVLMPLAPVNSFLRRLNETIFVLGGAAVLLCGVLFGFVARTITKPLDNLVAGVRALANGDYHYGITPKGSSEVFELGTAFAQMRRQLLASQQERIGAERIAALATAASSISHDLRHYLATVVANAEFLYEAEELRLDKKEIYEEIKVASNQMTDLIDSLRELSSQRSAISPVPASLTQIIRQAIEAIHAKPEFRHNAVSLTADGDFLGVFDPKKLERVIFNLLLNAFEAATQGNPVIGVDIRQTASKFEIRVKDNGTGIPDAVRSTLFDPFVSYGKPNGTGLGLAIVSKIVQDHEGSVSVESSSSQGTVLLIQLPRAERPAPEHAQTTAA